MAFQTAHVGTAEAVDAVSAGTGPTSRAGAPHTLLAEVYRAIVRAEDPTRMFADACRLAVERGGFLMAWIGTVADGRHVVPVASHGAVQGYLAAIDITATDTPAGLGPTGTAVRTGRHDVCLDIEHDPRMTPWRDRALARGYRSSGAFPFVVGDRVVGALMVYAGEVGFAAAEVVDLLDDLAADLGYALVGFERDARRQAAEDALRRSEERFRDAVEALLDGFATFDPVRDAAGRVVDLRCTYINEAGCRLNACAREDTVGRTVLQLVPGHAGADLINTCAHVIDTGEPFAREAFEHEDVSGERRLARVFGVRATRVGDGLVVSWRDVTEHNKAEEARRALTERLERSNEALQEFVYVASHDLSEPLRTVTGFVQLLQRRYAGRLDADADEFIALAVDGCNRMLALIDGLLTYSRVTTKAQPPVRVATGDVVAHVVELLGARVEETGAVVEVGELPEVAADRVQLAQVFQNLLTNAMKFVAPGVTPHIAVTAAPTVGEWRFVVADTGIGVDPAQRDRLFTMFSRLTAREDYPGSGIGLAVCRRIVERHGGRIWHEDNPGGGSRFCFTLPDGEARP